MTTLVISPRPEQIAERAISGQPVMAQAVADAWATVGESYELLTIGAAPGNPGRTVAAPHDHGQAGPGVPLAQGACRWHGLAGVGQPGGLPATAHPLGLAYTYAWAGVVQAYGNHDLSLVLFGRSGAGAAQTEPTEAAGVVVLELDGAPVQFERLQAAPGHWGLRADLGTVAPGPHWAALKINTLAAGGEQWAVDGAEVWPTSNGALVVPA